MYDDNAQAHIGIKASDNTEIRLKLKLLHKTKLNCDVVCSTSEFF